MSEVHLQATDGIVGTLTIDLLNDDDELRCGPAAAEVSVSAYPLLIYLGVCVFYPDALWRSLIFDVILTLVYVRNPQAYFKAEWEEHVPGKQAMTMNVEYEHAVVGTWTKPVDADVECKIVFRACRVSSDGSKTDTSDITVNPPHLIFKAADVQPNAPDRKSVTLIVQKSLSDGEVYTITPEHVITPPGACQLRAQGGPEPVRLTGVIGSQQGHSEAQQVVWRNLSSTFLTRKCAVRRAGRAAFRIIFLPRLERFSGKKTLTRVTTETYMTCARLHAWSDGEEQTLTATNVVTLNPFG